jgi:hypothetical protein
MNASEQTIKVLSPSSVYRNPTLKISPYDSNSAFNA